MESKLDWADLFVAVAAAVGVLCACLAIVFAFQGLNILS